jgi:acyl-CoA synthetase (AMP-forming)/AMP-acid ligase II
MFISQLTAEDHYIDGSVAPCERLRSVGRATLASELRVIGEDGDPLGNGQVGEIAVRGAFTMSYYYQDEVATAQRSIDGFQRTGDVGYLDLDGYLTIVGRRSDLMITGGFNVYPAEVESALAALPGVREAAVFGLPDLEWGEAVTAAVTLYEGIPHDEDELRRAVRKQLGGVKTPKQIHVLDELPRNDNGKILKRQLIELFGQ